jgi:hypothetical protein
MGSARLFRQTAIPFAFGEEQNDLPFEVPLGFGEGPLPHVCESLKRLGYTRNNQVRLYGQVFYLVSDVKVNDHLVFVEAWEPKSQQNKRVSIPST